MTRQQESAEDESASQTYQFYSAEREKLFEHSKWIYDNLDKWLLGLASAGFAATITTIVLGTHNPKSLDMFFAYAVGSFGLAVFFSIVGKSVSYAATLVAQRILETAYDDPLNFYERARSRPWHYKLLSISVNVIAFITLIFFLLGVFSFGLAGIRTLQHNKEIAFHETPRLRAPAAEHRAATTSEPNPQGTTPPPTPSETSGQTYSQARKVNTRQAQ